MIYKIIVDKQPLTNPSADKREYEIDIEELRYKHEVYDSLVITFEEDYVMRRLELTDYNVLVELDPPIKEPLENINIELFEGENYIYIYDTVGNKIVAEYLVKNEFNKLYVTESEMHSTIRQSANEIELSVGGQITTLSGAIQDINADLSLKVDLDDNDQIISMINASADVISLTGNRINITSSHFKLTDTGEVSVVQGNFKVVYNNNNKSIDFDNSGIRFFTFDTEEIGGLVKTQQYVDDHYSGKLFLTLTNGDTLNISKTSSDGTYFTNFMRFDDINSVPYIRNTVDGTLFPDNGSGITVNNGLITDWSFYAKTADITINNVTMSFKSGILTNVQYS